MTLIATGEWEVANDTDYFTAQLVAGQSYVIELIGADGTVLRLQDENGLEIGGFAANGLPGHFTAETSGTYTFSAMGTLPGDYQIRLVEVADDFADNAASTGVVRNGVARGRVEAAADSDWFAADLVAGQAYSLSVTSGITLGIQVFDADGMLIDLPPPANNGRITWVPEVSGRYEIVVVADPAFGDFAPSTYTLNVTPVAHVDDWGSTPATAGAITLGGGANPSGTATGNWELRGDDDWFAVQLVAGQTYSVRATSNALTGGTFGTIAITSPDGFFVSLPGEVMAGGHNGTSFTAATSGTYYVQMSSFDGTGAYTVQVAQIADDFTNSSVRPGTVAVNGTAAGVFEANNDIDWFRVDLVAGQSYTTMLTPQSARDWFGFASFVEGDGTLAFGAAQTFTATRTGSFYVQALGFTDAANPRSGAYTLSVNSYRDDFADNVSTSGRLTVGGSVTGRTEVTSDEDWFRVTLEAGKSYVFSGEGAFPGIPVTIVIYDASGAAVDADGAFTAQASGHYFVEVIGFFPGAYTLTAAEYADDYGEPLPQPGSFVDAGPYDGGGVTRLGTAGADRLAGSQRDDYLRGLDGADRLTGKGGDDLLDGGAGKDRMTGGAGDDTYLVDDRGDRVIEKANEGHDHVVSTITYTLGDHVEALTLSGTAAIHGTGNALANTIRGNAAANRIDGGAGDDVLDGGAGQDQLTGGSGADTFVFRPGETGDIAATGDRILDFSQAEGDRIDLSFVGEVQPLDFIGTTRFSGTAGELRYLFFAGDTYVQADLDGDRSADLFVRVMGVHDFVAADFLL